MEEKAKKYWTRLCEVAQAMGVILQADMDGHGELELCEVIASIKSIKDGIEYFLERNDIDG